MCWRSGVYRTWILGWICVAQAYGGPTWDRHWLRVLCLWTRIRTTDPLLRYHTICIRHRLEGEMCSSQHKSPHQARAFMRGLYVVTSAKMSPSRRTQRCSMYFLVRISVWNGNDKLRSEAFWRDCEMGWSHHTSRSEHWWKPSSCVREHGRHRGTVLLLFWGRRLWHFLHEYIDEIFY